MLPEDFINSLNPEPLTKNSLSFKELSDLALWLNEAIESAKKSGNIGDSKNEGLNQ